jgi:hypothetical protein
MLELEVVIIAYIVIFLILTIQVKTK